MTTLLIESLHQPLSAIARETRDATGSFEGKRIAEKTIPIPMNNDVILAGKFVFLGRSTF